MVWPMSSHHHGEALENTSLTVCPPGAAPPDPRITHGMYYNNLPSYCNNVAHCNNLANYCNHVTYCKNLLSYCNHVLWH